MDTAPLLVRDLHKSYGNFQVLQGLNLEIEPHAIMGLVGLNGSGKTTTIECLLGLQRFQAGNISILGHGPASLHRLQGDVVAIFDSPSLHANLTLGQCLSHAALLCPNPVRSVEEVEQLLSIQRYHRFKVRQLSLGNKRRASIAQALIGNPKLIILDEPFNGLDAGGVDDVLALITRLNREHGIAFLLSSHQLPYLEQVCSHFSILDHGSIVRSGSMTSLLEGSADNLELVTADPELAIDLLRDRDGVELLTTEGGRLTMRLERLDSAAVNQELVSAGVPVTELRLQRASLSALFREITGDRP